MEGAVNRLEKKILKLDEYYNDEIYHLTGIIQDLEDNLTRRIDLLESRLTSQNKDNN